MAGAGRVPVLSDPERVCVWCNEPTDRRIMCKDCGGDVWVCENCNDRGPGCVVVRRQGAD